MAENVGDGSTGENPGVAQPTSFEFDDQSRAAIDVHCAKYPPGREASAVIAAATSMAASRGSRFTVRAMAGAHHRHASA